MIFCIETMLMVFFWKVEVYSPKKISPAHFGPFLVQFGPFGSNISLKLVCDLELDLSIELYTFFESFMEQLFNDVIF